MAPTFAFARSPYIRIHRTVPFRQYDGLSLQSVKLQGRASAFEIDRRRIQWYRCASTNATSSTTSRGVTLPVKRKDISPPIKQQSTLQPPSSPPAKRAPRPTTVPARSAPKAIAPANIAPAASDVSSEFTSKLNPPDFLHPPELIVPSREPGQLWLKYALRTGRAYLSFYKSGIKNTWTASKVAKKLRSKATSDTALTRAEWQTVVRSRKDVRRLPAFGMLVLVFGEWLPLFVLFLTPLIPEVCRIPTQRRRVLEKLERRREERERQVRLSGTANMSLLGLTARKLKDMDVNSLQKSDLLSVSARLDCHARIWDTLSVTPPSALLRRNVASKVTYLKRDDDLILRGGGCRGLEAREVERACIERGMDVQRKEEKDLRTCLDAWFLGR